MALVINPPWLVQPERVDGLPADAFIGLLQTEGQRALYMPAIECVCQVGAERDRERVDCPVCDGERHAHPVALQVETRVLAQDVTRDKNLMSRIGSFEAGTIKITMRGEFCPGVHDHVRLLDAVLRMQALRTRSASGVDVLRHPIVVPDNLVIGPLETDVAETGVIYVQVQNPTTGLPGAVLQEGVDFDVTVAGAVDWAKGDVLGAAPLAGTGRYSITYFTRPVYVFGYQTHAVRRAQTEFGVAATKWQIMPIMLLATLDNAATQTF